MKIDVKNSTLVAPAAATPNLSLWIANVDVAAASYHLSSVYFYRPKAAEDFFNATVLKEGLGRALVAFYPLAGRLKRDEHGRIEIDYNAEGFSDEGAPPLHPGGGLFSGDLKLPTVGATATFVSRVSPLGLGCMHFV